MNSTLITFCLSNKYVYNNRPNGELVEKHIGPSGASFGRISSTLSRVSRVTYQCTTKRIKKKRGKS